MTQKPVTQYHSGLGSKSTEKGLKPSRASKFNQQNHIGYSQYRIHDNTFHGVQTLPLYHRMVKQCIYTILRGIQNVFVSSHIVNQRKGDIIILCLCFLYNWRDYNLCFAGSCILTEFWKTKHTKRIFYPGGYPSQSIAFVSADMHGLIVRCGKIHVFLLYSIFSGWYHLLFTFHWKPWI